MRAIILILIIAILALIAAVATGFLNISQVRGGRAPQLSTTSNGVSAKGGQAPAFDVQTGSVSVGSARTTVKVPTLQVQRPGNQQTANQPTAATTNNSM